MTLARSRPSAAGSLDDLPIPDRALLPERYWTSYLSYFKGQNRKVFDSSNIPGIATMNRARGCARAKDRCRYCGIADLAPRGSSPDLFWQDVRRAREQVRATVLHEVFDSATSWPALCKQWADARPDDLGDTRFFMYAQAAETNLAIVEIFRQLGVFAVNTGFDSGDDATLRLLKGQHDSVEINRAAARRWTDSGIEIHASFVLIGLGSDDATRRALDRTLEFAEWLATSTSTVALDRAMMYPDKSSPVGSWIWNPELAKQHAGRLGWTFLDPDLLEQMSDKWRDQVVIDPLEMCIDFAQVCGVNPEILMEYDRRLEEIAGKMAADRPTWVNGIATSRSIASRSPVSKA